MLSNSVTNSFPGRITFESTLDAAVRDGKTFNRTPKPPRLSRHPVNASALAPEEVLFRRKAAPERFAELDVYMAHERDLPDTGPASLPDADLLKAVHSYASHYYSALGGPKQNSSFQVGSRNIDERSMDESALLAFGILLEEAAKDVLGKKGDMVFTEGLEIPADTDPTSETRPIANPPSHPLTAHSSRHPTSIDFADLGSWKRAPKRRKMTDPDDS